VDRRVGELNAGEARMVGLPSDRQSSYATVDGAALCFGDGGGGAYVMTDVRGGNRVLVGVNSRSDLTKRSWVSVTHSQLFLEWARSWAAANEAGICGLQGETFCRTDSTSQPIEDAPASLQSLNAQKTLALMLPDRILSDGTTVSLNRLTKVSAHKGETVRDVARRGCGEVNNEYFTQLANYYQSFGQTVNASSPISSDSEFGIPPCPRPAQSTSHKEVIVRSGDTAWKYYTIVLAEYKGGPRWRDFRAPTGTGESLRGEFFLEALRKLNPGRNMDQLELGSTMRIPTSPIRTTGMEKLVAINPSAVKPIFALQSAEGKCEPPLNSQAYPYDVALLLDVLSTNKLYEPAERRRPARVLIADSGLYGVRQGIFRDNVLVKTTGSWDSFETDVLPLNRGFEPMHGTQVASLALGGPLFGRIQALGQPRLELIVKRIYRKYAQPDGSEFYGMEDQWFELIEAAIRKHSADIVNLSLATENDIQTLKNLLNAQSVVLFVVAAGNQGKLLGNANNNEIKPAVYGGETVVNLLVVGALDAKGNLAHFSNSGPEFIDIGAPGCSIPVLSYDLDTREWKLDRMHGTSLATPFVSFGAALIRSEKVAGMKPVDVKRRLLVSADLRSDLLKVIKDGRILNLTKAAALYQDVIELNDNGRLIFGEMTLVQDGSEFSEDFRVNLSCGGQPRSPKVRDIFKLVPNFKNSRGEVVTKIYYRASSSDGLFTNEECDVLKNITILINDRERSVAELYKLEDIKDLTRKDLPQS
jgi:hypothetical protein